MEIVVLKFHLMTEVLLKVLLALRLGIEIKSMPSISFSSLVVLALGGPGKRELKKDLFRLNELRNDLAHEPVEIQYSSEMWPFIRRWQRATAPKQRVRWVHFAKIRFLKINFLVMMEIIKLAFEGCSHEEREQLGKELPIGWEAILSSPGDVWRALVDRPLWQAPLTAAERVMDAGTAARAIVDGHKIRFAIIDELVKMHLDGRISEEELASIASEDDAAREHARRLFKLTTQWMSMTLLQDFDQDYRPFVERVEQLRRRVIELREKIGTERGSRS